MKNNRKIEVGQIREIRCSNELENILYVILRIKDYKVWVKELNQQNDKLYCWSLTDCHYDVVVM